MNIQTETDIDTFHGSSESKTLEFKRQPVKSDKLVQHIQGGMNGTEASLTIIFGVDEDSQGRMDANTKSAIQFPLSIAGAKSPFDGFDDYRLHLINMLYSNTENFRDGLINIREVALSNGGALIVIDVWQSEDRPHQNTKDHRFYIRGDGQTRPMSSADLRKSYGIGGNEPEQFPLPLPFGPGNVIADVKGDWAVGGDEIILIEGDMTMTLRLIPRNNQNHWSSTELRKLKEAWGESIPTLGRWQSGSYARNEHGFVMYGLMNNQPSKTSTITQLFKNGEIASIESFVPSDPAGKGIIPSGYVVDRYIATLFGVLNCMINALKIDPPYAVVCSLDRIKGNRLAISNMNYSEQCVESLIESMIEIDDSDISRIFGSGSGREYIHECRITLAPFFEEIWDACGIEWNPDH